MFATQPVLFALDVVLAGQGVQVLFRIREVPSENVPFGQSVQ
jgi:hypothetical protein